MDIDERSWETIAADSVLMNAVSNWRKDPEKWIEYSIDRLNETVRVNPLRDDIEWVENWLQKIEAVKIEWFTKRDSHDYGVRNSNGCCFMYC